MEHDEMILEKTLGIPNFGMITSDKSLGFTPVATARTYFWRNLFKSSTVPAIKRSSFTKVVPNNLLSYISLAFSINSGFSFSNSRNSSSWDLPHLAKIRLRSSNGSNINPRSTSVPW